MALDRFLADQRVKMQQKSLPFRALLELFKSIIPLDKVQGTQMIHGKAIHYASITVELVVKSHSISNGPEINKSYKISKSGCTTTSEDMSQFL
jgi:hypothetical protein